MDSAVLSILEKKARGCQPAPHLCCSTLPMWWLLAFTAKDSSGSDCGWARMAASYRATLAFLKACYMSGCQSGFL